MSTVLLQVQAIKRHHNSTKHFIAVHQTMQKNGSLCSEIAAALNIQPMTYDNRFSKINKQLKNDGWCCLPKAKRDPSKPRKESMTAEEIAIFAGLTKIKE